MYRRPRFALLVAAGAAGGMLVVWFLAFHVGFAMRADAHVLEGFHGLDRGPLRIAADVVPHLSDPKPFTLFSILIVATALIRGRRRLALATAVVLVGANLSTQYLKPLLAAPRSADVGFALLPGIWPSGHSTASMCLALCAVLVAPVRWRPTVAALGAAYSLAVTFTLLIAVWHFPSDVLGGYLMAGLWTSLAVAVLWWAEGRRPVRAAAPPTLGLRAALAPAALLALACLAFAAFVAVLRPAAVADYAAEHTTFVLGAATIGVLGLTLAATTAAAMTTTWRVRRPRLRRSGRSATPPAATAAPPPGSPPGRG